MEYAVIDMSTGFVVNRIILDAAEWQPPEGHEIVEDEARTIVIGGTYAAGHYTPPVSEPLPPLPIPQDISRRQFFQKAAIAGFISQEEAIAAVATGTIPEVFERIINRLPTASQRFDARMALAGSTYRLSHPLTAAFAAEPEINMAPAALAQFWQEAGELP